MTLGSGAVEKGIGERGEQERSEGQEVISNDGLDRTWYLVEKWAVGVYMYMCLCAGREKSVERM